MDLSTPLLCFDDAPVVRCSPNEGPEPYVKGRVSEDRPLLKWPGGKAVLAPRIALALGPCEGTYFEPFLGSAAVFLHLKRRGFVSRAVLSDVNPKVVEAHRAIRDQPERVLALLQRLPSDDWREQYYKVREAFNAGPHKGAAHAARLLWINKTCFNGLYRENRKRRFNVPIGSYDSLRLPSPDRVREVSRLLQGTELRACSFEEVLAEAGAGDRVYCDPPYVPLSPTASFTSYAGQTFRDEDQQRLADRAGQAAAAGARVVLTNHDLPVVRDDLYAKADGFEHVAQLMVRRSISRGRRAPAPELLAAIGPLCSDAQAVVA